MNITQYKEALKICRTADLPLMAWGPGGVGKTRGSEQAAQELKISHLMIQGPLYQPIDILGLPDRNKNKTIWLRPEILPEEGEGIISIEELPDSAPLMQKAYYQLILEKKVQSHIIPDSWYIHGTGNRPEDGGFSSPMPAPLITRFIHIGVCCDCPDFTNETPKSAIIDVDDFINYSIKNFNPLVSAFLKFKSDYIYKNQATPRTWEYISDLLNSEKDHYSFIFKELIKGTIGSGVGREFNAFVNIASRIPSIDAIIADPFSIDVPSEMDVLYAVVTSLISRTKIENANNIIEFIGRLGKEFQFFYFASVRVINKDIIANAKYINWSNDNKEYLI